MQEDYLLAQSTLTATQHKVLHAVRYLENPTLQGVKYLTGLQMVRVHDAVTMLARKRLVEVSGGAISLTPAENWCEKCLHRLRPCERHKVLNLATQNRLGAMRAVSLNNLHGHSIVALVEKKMGFSYTQAKWAAEVSNAVKLYRLALSLTRNEAKAALAIVDFVDFTLATNDNFRSRVRFPVAVLYSSFGQWYAAIPQKPRRVLEDERITGCDYRYNMKTKRWEARTNGKPNSTGS